MNAKFSFVVAVFGLLLIEHLQCQRRPPSSQSRGRRRLPPPSSQKKKTNERLEALFRRFRKKPPEPRPRAETRVRPRRFRVRLAPKYMQVYRAIKASLRDRRHDDGSWAALYLRLAFHASATYDRRTRRGGWADGASMRFTPEKHYDDNRGLKKARQRLERIRQRFDSISFSDVWSLAGVVAVQESGGPEIKWRPGRKDAVSGAQCPVDKSLPSVDSTPSAEAIEQRFARMGFSNFSEVIALIGGGHSLGRMHKANSGFVGQWTRDNNRFGVDYFHSLFRRPWFPTGTPHLLTDRPRRFSPFAMLSTDLEIRDDRRLSAIAHHFFFHPRDFFDTFSVAFSKLLHLGMENNQ